MLLIVGLMFIILLLILLIKLNYLNKKIKTEREIFIKTLSHDLRVASLAQIRALDILQKSLTAEQAEFVREINDSCKYSFDMITTLLNTYKFKKGESILNYEKINFVSIINKVCEQKQLVAREKNIILKVLTDSEIYLEADKDMLFKTVLFFVQTAIINSWQNEKISISAKNNKDMLEFSVGYKGLSLTDEEYNRMFSDEHAYTTVGQGIKMRFCKKVIDFHRGNIKICNQGQNKILLTFVIPLFKMHKERKVLIPLDCSQVVV